MFDNEFHKITESSMIEVQDTDFYVCGHEMNPNSGMPGLKQRLVVFWAPKWPHLRASNSCESMPLASVHMLTYALGYSAAYSVFT